MSAYLVELLIELAELSHFLHDLLPHEERRVERGVVLAVQDPQGVVDQRLLQEHQGSLKAARGAETGARQEPIGGERVLSAVWSGRPAVRLTLRK